MTHKLQLYVTVEVPIMEIEVDGETAAEAAQELREDMGLDSEKMSEALLEAGVRLPGGSRIVSWDHSFIQIRCMG